VQLIGSGTILREAMDAAELLRNDFGVAADVWSATSFNLLRRDGLETARWNMLHPEEKPRASWVEQCLQGRDGPVVGVSDYIKSFADGISPFVNRRFHALGTDGFGRSDFRRRLRNFFEVDRRWIALAAIKSLADEGKLKPSDVTNAMKKLEISADKPNPVTV
jgi:pyruvate dehydrogenase E1 component